MAIKAVSAILHPMALAIGKEANKKTNQEEENLLSLLIIYLEATTQVYYVSQKMLPQAITELQTLMTQLHTFEDVKQLAKNSNVTHLEIARLWRKDAFFDLDDDEEYANYEMLRKSECLRRIKKTVAELSERYYS